MRNLEKETGYERLLPCVPLTEIVAHQVQGRRILQQFREKLYETVKKMFLDKNNYFELEDEKKWKKQLELFFELVEQEPDYDNRLYSLCSAFGEEESLTLLMPTLKKETMNTLTTAFLIERQVKEILETNEVNLSI